MRYWKFNRGGSSSYLMHHGIDGQRWGVQHGPPYPLDSKVSTGRKLKVKTKKLAQYNKTEQARIRSGAQLGAYVGGIPGAVIGQHLSKKHIEQEKAGVRNKNYTNEDYTSRNMNTATYGPFGRALTTHKIKKENRKSEVNDTSKAESKNTYASEKMINKWSKETKGGNVISDAMEKALFDDDYDVDFLEKIQNESYFEGNDDSSVNKRLTEYKKYLTNKHSKEGTL